MNRSIAVAGGVVACLLATGCGTLRAGAGPAPGTGPARQSSATPTAAGNQELARREAQRLLALATVPGDAVPLASAPSSLSGPALGTPEVGSLIDQSRSWRVPMPLGQMAAWLRAHRPPGLGQDGTTSGEGPGGISTVGYGYTGPRGPAWQSAQLEVGVAAAGRGASVLRADGVVIWLDPSPTLDNEPGPRARVTVAGGCPRSGAGLVGVTNPGATDLARRLLPAAAPTAGLKCDYNGMNGPGRRPRSVSRLNAAAARRVAASMAGLSLSHTDGGVMSCPAGNGSAEILALAYPGRPDVDLWVSLGGCDSGAASNGYITAGLAG